MRLKLFAVAGALSVALAAALFLTFELPLAHAQDNVATVNGVAIPQSRVDLVLKSQVQQGQQDTPEIRQKIKDFLVTREVIAQEAIKKGFEKSPDVQKQYAELQTQLQTQVDMAKQEALIRAYFTDLMKTATPTEEQTKAEYDKIKAAQTAGGKNEYRARHILVKTDKEAKAVMASLNKANGKNFAQLAKTKSTDTGSKAEGGLLEWSDGSNFVKEFSDALTKLQKGQYTKEPVKTRFGYHIIMLEDTRAMQFPPYEQVKERVQQELLKQVQDKKIEELRAAAKVQ